MGVPLDEHGDRIITSGVAGRLLPGVEHALAVIADPNAEGEDRPHTLGQAVRLLREEAEWLKRNRDRR